MRPVTLFFRDYASLHLLSRHCLIFTLLAIAVCGWRPASADYTSAGLMQWSFNYHDTRVPVAIWFPTPEPASPINAGPFTLVAASDVAMQETQHPLVIISHGTGGSNIAHHPVAEALAKNGYMVAALTHPGDNYQDRSLVADDRYFDERPRQLAALLAALSADDKLGPLIDRERVGAVGHSAGGYSVAVLVGAVPDRQLLIDHCSQVNDDPSCFYRDPSIGVTSTTSKPFILPDVIADTADAETADTGTLTIRSVALLAPLGRVIDASSTIDPVVAVKIVSAELDQVLPHRYHSERLQQVAQHSDFREAKGAGHFSFIAPIENQWKQQLGEVALDPEGFDRQGFNRQLGEELSSWFINTLPVAAR